MRDVLGTGQFTTIPIPLCPPQYWHGMTHSLHFCCWLSPCGAGYNPCNRAHNIEAKLALSTSSQPCQSAGPQATLQLCPERVWHGCHTTGQQWWQPCSGDAIHTLRGLRGCGVGYQWGWYASGDPEPDSVVHHQWPANSPACQPCIGLSQWAPTSYFLLWASERCSGTRLYLHESAMRWLQGCSYWWVALGCIML